MPDRLAESVCSQGEHRVAICMLWCCRSVGPHILINCWVESVMSVISVTSWNDKVSKPYLHLSRLVLIWIPILIDLQV